MDTVDYLKIMYNIDFLLYDHIWENRMRFVKYISILSLFFIYSLDIVLSRDLPVTVTLSSQYQPSPGSFALVDIIIDSDSPIDYLDIDGLQLMLAYDSSKLTLWDIHAPLLNDSCNWEIIFSNNYFDDSPISYLWVKAAATLGGSLPGSGCFRSDMAAMTIEFLVSNDIDPDGDSTSVDFIWLSCDDNCFWLNQNDTILIADSVFNSDSLNITNDTQSFPSKTGPNINCFNASVKGDTTFQKDLNFYSTKIYFQFTTGISEPGENIPLNYQLGQNYPNPFNPITNIDFYLPIKSHWKLEITNITGQQIRKYVGEDIGSVTVNWDSKNNDHSSVASGIYFYKITTENYSDSKKMILLK